MRPVAVMLAAALVLALAGQAFAGAAHRPKYSRLDRKGNFLPVTQDHSFSYYRFKLDTKEKFIEAYDPHPALNVTLIDAAVSGDLTSGAGGKVVGHYGYRASLVKPRTPSNSLAHFLINVVAELGPRYQDTIILGGSADVPPNRVVRDHDMAILGGTGRYLGATGHAFVHATSKLKLFEIELEMEVYVPKLHEF